MFRQKIILIVLLAILLGLIIHYEPPPHFAQLSANSAGNSSLQELRGSDASDVNDQAMANLFIALLIEQEAEKVDEILSAISLSWDIRYIPYALEVMRFTRSIEIKQTLNRLIDKTRGTSSIPTNPESSRDHYFWIWNQDINNTEAYSEFKANLYLNIDSKFEAYFRGRGDQSDIRLDEVQWGGVVQDGIPPLRNPKMIRADEADYLGVDNVIFGIEINGDSRAYPKRILAWHEMFTDTIGGVSIAGVYCTLCGAVIPYRTRHQDTDHQLGTSGFLYRSNKLMYDQATQSLWSTTRGTPVLGPLLNKDIHLERESVVTTTWGEWKKRHPDTTVLSLETGYKRDYGEGVAYANYFATDRLMFTTQLKDKRLQNKDEILALRFNTAPDKQLAIAVSFLEKNPLYTGRLGTQAYLVLTDKTGANRVYDPGEVKFVSYDGERWLVDSQGKAWMQYENWLASEDGERIQSLPYHRAFWFGWVAAFPNTQLIK